MKYNLYYYLFYRLVRMNDVLFPDYKNGDNFPIIGEISVLHGFNIFSILIVIENTCEIVVISRFLIISIGATSLLINYLLLQWRGKDKKIYAYYKERETEGKRNLGLFFTWIYIVGTWGVFIWVANN